MAKLIIAINVDMTKEEIERHMKENPEEWCISDRFPGLIGLCEDVVSYDVVEDYVELRGIEED